MKLFVKDIIGTDTAVSTDDGEKLFAEIDKTINNNEMAILDFEGIDIMTTAFLNAAIGQLYNTYKGDKLNKLLKLRNVDKDDIGLFKKVIERAKEFFNNKKRFEDSANQAIYGTSGC